mmetsp:Transcript_28023/g.39127  ORF Transcript_28023/g.39127 Transcript_28023/m.39127 type:complete len:150 (-) Transcript_28023:498-947(-)
MVRFLLEHKANVNSQSLYGWTPAMLACIGCEGQEDDRLEIIKYFWKNKASASLRDRNSYDVLLTAASQNQYDIIRYLVGEVKANVNSQRTRNGMESSIMFAADHNCDEIVKYIVEEGFADINGLKDNNGNTVMHRMAAHWTRPEWDIIC